MISQPWVTCLVLCLGAMSDSLTTWFRLGEGWFPKEDQSTSIRRRGNGYQAGKNNWCSLQRPLARVEGPEMKVRETWIASALSPRGHEKQPFAFHMYEKCHGPGWCGSLDCMASCEPGGALV